MTGYSHGKHDDPADTQDRLARVGTKYQSSAPTVADGDNVYLLVDSAGRPIVVGPAAEDAAVVGSPLLAGGRHDATDRTLDDGDVGGIALDAAGRVKVAGPSATGAVAAMPGASEVKSTWVRIGATSVTRATVATPASGKKIRVIELHVVADGLTGAPLATEIYFGTGAAISTTITKAIASQRHATTGQFDLVWPDGGGPVGAVDDVLSWRTQGETDGDTSTPILSIVAHYREE